jgi:tryptophanyl-tRNA synthetase
MSAQVAKKLARVFSGIQPSGVPHLGNYFGALTLWIKLSNERRISNTRACLSYDDDVQYSRSKEPKEGQHNTLSVVDCDTPILSIVDVHAYSSANIQFGVQFYRNILDTTASLLAVGLNTQNCIMFRQSDLMEHNYLDNVLHNFITTQRLTRMTQYKERLSSLAAGKGVCNGLLTYPVLQAADILLYKTNLVPIGADQVQHIELTRDIAKNFNKITSSSLFVEPNPLLNNSEHARRIKSLRDPNKKMSKSDPDKKSMIEIMDKPDVIREKVKKAVTDNISEVYFDAEARPGVSNLIRIHHLTTGESFDNIRDRSVNITTAQYKLQLADILIEKFKPFRCEFERLRNERVYLEDVLRAGADKARPMASEMILQVKDLLGSIRI